MVDPVTVLDAWVLRWRVVLRRCLRPGGAAQAALVLVAALWLGPQGAAQVRGLDLGWRVAVIGALAVVGGAMIGRRQAVPPAVWAALGTPRWRMLLLSAASSLGTPAATVSLWLVSRGVRSWVEGVAVGGGSLLLFAWAATWAPPRPAGPRRRALAAASPVGEACVAAVDRALRVGRVGGSVVAPLGAGVLAAVVVSAVSTPSAAAVALAVVGAGAAGVSAGNGLADDGPGLWLEASSGTPGWWGQLGRSIVPALMSGLCTLMAAALAWRGGHDPASLVTLGLASFGWAVASGLMWSVLWPCRVERQRPVARDAAPAGRVLLVQSGLVVTVAAPIAGLVAAAPAGGLLLVAAVAGAALWGTGVAASGALIERRWPEIITLLSRG